MEYNSQPFYIFIILENVKINTLCIKYEINEINETYMHVKKEKKTEF